MTDRELMQQALEALVTAPLDHNSIKSRFFELRHHAIEALRERLAQPKQEPVACIGTNGELMWLHKPHAIYSKARPLYTAPPQRKSLTDDEMVKFSQFLTDVVTAAGLLSHGKTDKALALRLSEFAFNLRTAPPQRKPLTEEEIADEWERVTGHNISHGDRQEGRAMYISPEEVTEFARAVIAKATGEKK
jgi:hypothetical protein